MDIFYIRACPLGITLVLHIALRLEILKGQYERIAVQLGG